MTVLSKVAYGDWQLGIGDPSFIDLITATGYIIGAIYSALTVRKYLYKN